MRKTLQFFQAVVGLIFLALGITLLIAAEGPDPWGVLVLAMHQHLPLSLGITSQVAGLILISINMFWGKRRPGLATVMSMVLVGVFMDMFGFLTALGHGLDLVWQVGLMLLGITAMAFGISVYVRAGLGEGPVEGFMFVLSDKLGVNVGKAKIVQDLSFVICGFLLGWVPQVGTLVSAVAVGPVTQVFLRFLENKEGAKGAK